MVGLRARNGRIGACPHIWAERGVIGGKPFLIESCKIYQMRGEKDSNLDERGALSLFKSEIERAKARLNEIDLIDGTRNFRDDLEDMYHEKGDRQYSPEEKKKIRQVGRKGLKDAGEALQTVDKGVRVAKIADLTGSIVFFILTYFALTIPPIGVSSRSAQAISLGFTILLALIGRGTLYGKALIEELGYQRFPARLSSERYHFRAIWNGSVLQSSTSFLGVVIVGIIWTITRPLYQVGIENLREEVSEKWNN